MTRDYQNAKSMILESGDQMTCQTKPIGDLTCYGNDNDIQLVFRAIRAWYPEFIAFACPFVVCTLIGPAAVNVRLSNRTDTNHSQKDLNFDANMLKLVLERIGNFWEIGSCALGKSVNLQRNSDSLMFHIVSPSICRMTHLSFNCRPCEMLRDYSEGESWGEKAELIKQFVYSGPC